MDQSDSNSSSMNNINTDIEHEIGDNVAANMSAGMSIDANANIDTGIHEAKKSNRAKIVSLCILVVLGAVFVAVFLNREWCIDNYRAFVYRPTKEVEAVREKIKLTGYGEFLFSASQPVLEGKDDFNNHCREQENTTAILGCYRDKTIYVYNIAESELDGITEVTLAHELLHAVYERMDKDEKNSLSVYLNETFEKNWEVLAKDLENYEESMWLEELYVRVGTEISSLPEELETHYANYFQNQDLIVSYYNKYIGKFNELKAKLQTLEDEMAVINNEILAKNEEFEFKLAQLNNEIEEFNSCAKTMGCFSSQQEFQQAKNVIIAEQSELSVLNDEINELVTQYNTKVEEYNKNVLKGKKLNNAINSSVETEKMAE